MNYDIVLVTHNRRAVLEISIPLMLAQSRLPQQFILVDSSADHLAVVRTVEAIFAKFATKVPLLIFESRPCMTVQRNIGLEYVRSEVVMFPDDDALWYPEFASLIMLIYERDTEQLIGGVPGEDAAFPPPGVLTKSNMPHAITLRDKMILLLAKPQKHFECLPFMKDPAYVEGAIKSADKKIPGWLAEANAELVGPMVGFRMSFRTNSIVAEKFDENLGQYGLFEDHDASLRVMERQIMVKAKNALVYHYRSPENRANGFEWGMLSILNRAYIICKSARPDSVARKNLVPYALYKCIRYFPQCYNHFGRQRFKGAFLATRKIKALQMSPRENLPQVYLNVRAECLKHAPKPALNQMRAMPFA